MYDKWATPVPSRVLLLAGIAILLACRENGPQGPQILGSDEPPAQASLEAVDRFHAAIAQQRYADVCQAAEPTAFQATTDLPCEPFLRYVHDRLGNPKVANRSPLPIVADHRTGDRIRVELEYSTSYDHGDAKERFGWRIEKGKATLIGFVISAAGLSR